MSPLPITIFSDFTCPASYVTEAALRAMDDGSIELRYRAFEVFPDGSAPAAPRFTPDEWAGLEELASAVGVGIARRAALARTRKAHESAVFARQRGVEGRLREQIFRAFWEEGADIGRVDVLSGLAGRVGLDPEDLRIALDIDTFRDEVLADQDLARRLRVPGTPVLFFGTGRGARIVTGARGTDELRSLIHSTTRDRTDRTEDV